jgi:tetratricopeptide (TPR) repeat protein
MIRYRITRGQSPDLAVNRAIPAYDEALRLDPAFLWAHNELCSVYSARGLSETWRGLDPSASFEKALAQCGRASAIEPTLIYIHNNKVVLHNRRAAHLLELGRSPEPATKAALEVIADAKKQSPGATSPRVWEAFTYITQASYDNDMGEDGAFDLADKSVEEAIKTSSGTVAAELRGAMALLRAARLFRLGADPGPALTVARSVFRSAVDEAPWDITFVLYLARTEILGIRWALGRGEAKAGQFDAAEAPLLPMLGKERAQPHFYRSLAEIAEVKAAWLRSEKKDAGEVIAKGLEMTDKALAINPRFAAAVATKGSLYLERARASRDPAARSEAAQKAREAFAEAARENPVIARAQRPLLEEAERLVEKEP